VLVVDDNVDAAESLGLLLEVWGHEVRTAHDGPAALAVAEEFEPDLVLLDIGLPGMDGYEVARRLRSTAAVLVALTGYGLREDAERARAAGFAAHVVKPASPERLQQLLADVPRR
jgi:CheY-like chemotaxis protein